MCVRARACVCTHADVCQGDQRVTTIIGSCLSPYPMVLEIKFRGHQASTARAFTP